MKIVIRIPRGKFANRDDASDDGDEPEPMDDLDPAAPSSAVAAAEFGAVLGVVVEVAGDKSMLLTERTMALISRLFIIVI